MAQTSTMLALGTEAPAFTLPDVTSGVPVSLADVTRGRPFLVLFVCNHCPYVQHVEEEIGRIARDYAGRMVILAISSNDATASPDDAPAGLAAQAQRAGWSFPYLYDASQAVARAYDAACTPDCFLFDAAGRLAYRGRLDDSRPKSAVPVTGRDVRTALDAVLAGRAPTGDQQPSIGCGIKWK